MITQLGYRGDLSDRRALGDRLAETGLGAAACHAKAGLFARAVTVLNQWQSREALAGFFVPGRIEVLGKHTDYAGGRTMVAVTERGFVLVAAARADQVVRICDAATAEVAEFKLDAGLLPRHDHWSNYPMTVARRVARNFPGAGRGADIAFISDLPAAAGMSSSSAFMVATFLGLAEVNHLAARPEFLENIADLTDLADYLGTIENGQTFKGLVGDVGVGTFGGSEDHTAMLNARPNQVSQYSYAPVRFERTMALPEDYVFVLGFSGVVAAKTGTAREPYNRLSRRAARLAELWRAASGRHDPHLAAALASGPAAMGQFLELVEQGEPDEAEARALLGRLEHFVTENEQLLPAAGDALAEGDLRHFGELVDRSQLAAEKLLGNQIPQTVFLALSARAAGAVAASAFGAGFGGSVWALVDARQVDTFLEEWSETYRLQYPDESASARFFASAAGPAAFQL